jgi:DNA-binding CsgD family transcriptional regulator/PAS domain-containing protein
LVDFFNRVLTTSAMMLSAERLSSLVGAIYDCVIQPQHWPTVLGELRTATHCANAVLAANLLPSGEALISAVVGIPPEWLARINEHHEDVVNVWGGAERIAQYPLEEPVVCSQAVGWAHIQRNLFYRNWALPQGLGDSVSLPLSRSAAFIATLTMGRPADASAFTDEDLELLRLIAPHLRRAVTISRLLERQALTASTLAQTLDALSVAIALVDDQLAILHANRAARDLLLAGTLMCSKDGRLELASTEATRALRAATSIGGYDQACLSRPAVAVPVVGAVESAVAHVLPLVGGSMRGALMPQAGAAVFITRAAGDQRLPSDALATLYNLTPAEARVLELVAGGYTQAEIAQTLGVAPSTVKTHLLRVFDKTGRHRQADLVSLVASLTPPV